MQNHLRVVSDALLRESQRADMLQSQLDRLTVDAHGGQDSGLLRSSTGGLESSLQMLALGMPTPQSASSDEAMILCQLVAVKSTASSTTAFMDSENGGRDLKAERTAAGRASSPRAFAHSPDAGSVPVKPSAPYTGTHAHADCGPTGPHGDPVLVESSPSARIAAAAGHHSQQDSESAEGLVVISRTEYKQLLLNVRALDALKVSTLVP